MVNGYAPKTLAEALELRNKFDLVPYAGGTDLMVENRPNVSYLFLGKLAELKGICEDANYVRIGAAVTYTEALASPPCVAAYERGYLPHRRSRYPQRRYLRR